MSYKAWMQNAMKADEAWTSRTIHRHSVHSDNTGNSHRELCEHLGTHVDTRHSVGRTGESLETPADKEPNRVSFGYRI